MLFKSRAFNVVAASATISEGTPLQLRVASLLALAMAMACLGCTVVPSGASGSLELRDVAVVYLDAAGSSIPVSERPSGAEFRLSAVPGAVAGHPYQPLESTDVSTALRIDLKTHDLETSVGALAAPLTKEAIDTGLSLLPARTRFARVSTILTSKQGGKLLTGFYDSSTKHTLLLVYVDRRSRLTGTINPPYTEADDTSVVWDVVFNEGGLHWLDFVPTGSGRFRVIHCSSTPAPMIVGAEHEDAFERAFQIK